MAALTAVQAGILTAGILPAVTLITAVYVQAGRAQRRRRRQLRDESRDT